MRPWLLAVALLLARPVIAGLEGVTASAHLDAGTGGLEPPSSVVGTGTEFTGTLTSGLATVAVDIGDRTVTLIVVNRSTGNEINPDGVIRLDWRSLSLGGLTDPAGPLDKVVLIDSSFPTGTFDAVEVTHDSIRWDLEGVQMPGKGTRWRAVWRIALGNR
jgi:hypothetical protein